jgi:cyclopropane fatty-acyl-phospholipid synthase-like methyltransferase
VNRHEQRIQEQLAIPVNLLDVTAQKRPWSNLGDWSEASEYSAACHALACRIGRAAHLSSGDTLLEIACGHGASLSVWPEVFDVQVVDAIERQTRAIAAIERDRPAALRHLWQADVNSIFSGASPWPKEERYDALVVVDAAYHFNSLRGFLEASRSRLRSGGRIAFTTLILGSQWSRAADWKKHLALQLAARALIPAGSLVTEKELTESLLAAGFGAPSCEALDREVLEGFVRFVERRRKELGWRQRGSSGWWKVEVTAAAARYLLRTGLLHYVLVKAAKA